MMVAIGVGVMHRLVLSGQAVLVSESWLQCVYTCWPSPVESLRDVLDVTGGTVFPAVCRPGTYQPFVR